MNFDDSKVSYGIEVLPEYLDVRGNAMASGDDAFDREVEDSIIADFEGGNEWAWCTVKVTARYEYIDEIEGVDYLGACSYKDEEDFKDCGYYADMQDQARERLYDRLEGVYRKLPLI